MGSKKRQGRKYVHKSLEEKLENSEYEWRMMKEKARSKRNRKKKK